MPIRSHRRVFKKVMISRKRTHMPHKHREQLEESMQKNVDAGNLGMGQGYGISKAGLTALTLIQARWQFRVRSSLLLIRSFFCHTNRPLLPYQQVSLRCSLLC